MKNFTHRVIMFFMTVLTLLLVFVAGAEFADNSIADGVISLVTAAMIGSFVLLEVLVLARKARFMDEVGKEVHQFVHELDDVIARVKKKEVEEKFDAKAKATKREQARRPDAQPNSKVRSGSKGASKKAGNKSR